MEREKLGGKGEFGNPFNNLDGAIKKVEMNSDKDKSVEDDLRQLEQFSNKSDDIMIKKE